MAISMQYDGMAPKCIICENRIGGKYSLDSIWLHGLGLCSECAADQELVSYIEKKKDEYSESPILPSWWQRLWMWPLEAKLAKREIERRKEAARTAERQESRRIIRGRRL